MSKTFEKRGQHVIYRRDRLVVLYFTGKFEWPHSWTVWVIVEHGSFDVTPSADRGFGKSQFFFKSL